MKTPANFTAGLLFALAISAQAVATITYAEDFDSAGSSNQSLRWLTDNRPTGNWNANFSSSATAYDRTSTLSGTSPVVSGVGDFIFINTTNTNNNSVPIFVWTDSLLAGAASNFDSVRFGLRNDNATTEDVRIALQIAGVWYVTNTSYNGSDTSAILSTAGSTWSTLNITSVPSMSIGSTGPLPTFGKITGVGIYDENRSGAVRLDNISINTISQAVTPQYQTWADSYPSADFSDPTADNDDDGLSNFEEFAFGLDPTSVASVNPITEASQLSSGTFSYTMFADSGLTYTVWAATNLQHLGTEPVSVTENPGPPVDGVVTVVVTLNTPPAAVKQFVKVTAGSVP